MEKEPELIADRGRVRTKEDEEALDKKIAEIRKKNQLIEQRKELVEEDRANFINEYGRMSLDSGAKGTMYRNRRMLKPKKSGEWDREWDAGKISVENWKENVPDIDDNKEPSAHFLRGFKNRRSDIRSNKSNRYGNSAKNNAKTKKIVEITKKQKLEDSKVVVCIETNKNTSLAKKKIFIDKNAKKLKNCGNGNDNNGHESCNMKPMSKLKQSHAFSNGQPNRQLTRNYKKPSSESPRKRYSTRRIASIASAASLSTAVKQHLDTVKVNVSMLELEKDAQTIAKSNNNIGKVDNNLQKLVAIVADTAAISAEPTLPIAEEYEVNDNDIIMMEDVKKLMEEMLLQMK